MKVQLKKLAEQVIVITGATSGIGLTTARKAARRGASLVLVARNEEALRQLADQLAAQGCKAIAVAADVGRDEDMRRVAQTAIESFGGFDTWVNNAGVSIFGRMEDVALQDQRRLIDTNFWGVVHGSLAAVRHLKQKGGAIINVGSELSDVAVPLQGMYSASKHAVKGFTDSLRVELEAEHAPVSVTLIKPASIDTMFVRNAKNYMEVEPKLPAPVYAPELVADAILFAAAHPKRDMFVGGAAKFGSAGAHHMPGLADKIIQRLLFRQQRTDIPVQGRNSGNLHAAGHALQERHGYAGRVLESSLYTTAVMHPNATRVVMFGVGLALAALWRSRGSGPREIAV